MKKGKRISIQIEKVGEHGVITTVVMGAKVEFVNGDNVTVKADDGYLYEVDSNTRDSNTGAYPVASYE